MAYQRVRTPRFYVDLALFARHHGLIDESNTQDYGLFYLNPSKSKALTMLGDGNLYPKLGLIDGRGWLNSLQYTFILGHKMFSSSIAVAAYPALFESYAGYMNPIETVNCSVEGGGMRRITPDKDGWLLVRHDKDGWNGMNKFQVRFEGIESQGFSIGDVSFGWTYDMPHSPDLSLKLSYANESIKTQQTKGGHTLTSSGWSEPPHWVDLPQWVTNDPDDGVTEFRGLSASSRRAWDLSFSFLDETDMVSENYPGHSENTRGVMRGIKRGGKDRTFLFGEIANSFFSKVVHGTANFQLPFIFQPSADVNEFAICRIEGNSFTIEQVANNVYNTSMRITETF